MQANILFAQEKVNINMFSPENKLKFANHLFCNKDYLRSYDEYRSFLRDANNDTARFKMAYSLMEIGRYNEAGDHFKTLFYNSNLENESRIQFYKSHFLSGDFPILRELAQIEAYRTEVYDNNINQLLGFSYLLANSFVPDSADFFNSFAGQEKEDLLSFYKRKRNPQYKDVWKAGVLSAVVPGLGKVYADELGDGITSFLVTGLFTFLSIDNFNHGHKTRGWVFGALAGYFYAGNIYGSVSAAQIYNATIRFNFENDFKLYLNDKNYFIPKHGFLCE